MNPNWRSFLESAEANFSAAGDEVLDFGDAAGELLAAGKQTVVVPLTHLGVLSARGADAKRFLHNQLTNDINHLAAPEIRLAGWCNAKGRMLASLLAWSEAEDSYQLLLAADLLEATRKRLQMFVLRDKVTLEAADNPVLLGLAGAQADAALSDAGLVVPESDLQFSSADGITVLRLAAQRFVLAVPLAALPTLWQKLGNRARPAGVPVWRWLDVQAAFPLVTLATREEFVPQMADFDKLGGVSFHKGCYPGQEVVARTRYLGKVKRHLYRLSAEVALAAGDDLYSPENLEQAAGKVMTAAPSPTGGHVALAVVQEACAGNLLLGSRDGTPVHASAVNPD